MQVRLILCNRKYDSTKPHHYIGRPSPLGNPFAMTVKTIQERNRVCDGYESYFQSALSYHVELIGELLNLAIEHGVLQLVCFCSPERCHGDTVIGHLKDQLLSNGFDVIVERKENDRF